MFYGPCFISSGFSQSYEWTSKIGTTHELLTTKIINTLFFIFNECVLIQQSSLVQHCLLFLFILLMQYYNHSCSLLLFLNYSSKTFSNENQLHDKLCNFFINIKQMKNSGKLFDSQNEFTIGLIQLLVYHVTMTIGLSRFVCF